MEEKDVLQIRSDNNKKKMRELTQKITQLCQRQEYLANIGLDEILQSKGQRYAIQQLWDRNIKLVSIHQRIRDLQFERTMAIFEEAAINKQYSLRSLSILQEKVHKESNANSQSLAKLQQRIANLQQPHSKEGIKWRVIFIIILIAAFTTGTVIIILSSFDIPSWASVVLKVFSIAASLFCTVMAIKGEVLWIIKAYGNTVKPLPNKNPNEDLALEKADDGKKKDHLDMKDTIEVNQDRNGQIQGEEMIKVKSNN